MTAVLFSFNSVLTIFSFHRRLACKLQKQLIVCSFLCAFSKGEAVKTSNVTFWQLLSSEAECLWIQFSENNPGMTQWHSAVELFLKHLLVKAHSQVGVMSEKKWFNPEIA